MKSLYTRHSRADSTRCSVANADYLLIFRRTGENAVPVVHPNGLTSYAGEREVPGELLQYRGWKGSQLENRYSHWVWRQYASAFWDDVRLDRVLPHREGKDPDDEKHVRPAPTDVSSAPAALEQPRRNRLDAVMGVGSEATARAERAQGHRHRIEAVLLPASVAESGDDQYDNETGALFVEPAKE